MQNEIDFDEKGIGFRNFFKLMFGYNNKARIRGGIIGFLTSVIAFIVLFFIYNTMVNNYQTNFTYSINTLKDFKYLDGSNFNYKDLIALSTLKSVKESDSDFASIDVEAMYYDEDIKISINQDIDESYVFTINMKAKYFSSYIQAAKYANAIAEIPLGVTNSLIEKLSNDAYLVNYKNYSKTYNDLINALNSQAKVIEDKYASLIENYSSRFLSEDFGENVRLSDLRTIALKRIDLLSLPSFSYLLDSNDYVLDYDYELPYLETSLSNFNSNLAKVDGKITAIQAEIDRQVQAAGTSDAMVDALNNTLATLLTQKADLTSSIFKIEGKINNGKTIDTSSFDVMLDNAYNELEALTDELTKAEKEVYTSEQNIYYTSNQIVEETGYSTIIYLGVSILIGIVLWFISNLIIDFTTFRDIVQEQEIRRIKAKKEKSLEE